MPEMKEAADSPLVTRDDASWSQRVPCGGGVAAAHALGASHLSGSVVDQTFSSTASMHGRKHECRNMVLLGTFFTVYFVFRSGCLIVLPLTCQRLLEPELSGDEYS